MIAKLKWKELMNLHLPNNLFDEFEVTLEDIDDILNSKLREGYERSNLKDMMTYINENILSGEQSIWKDLPIWSSTFIYPDRRYILLLVNKLREYIGFYYKILTDNGIQRNLVYAKVYSNSGTSNSTDRGTNSDTPQNSNLYDPEHPTSSELFDQAIADFASNINKSTVEASSSNGGNSTTTHSGLSWEEAKKNVNMIFFNELENFISTIPERIYSMYSLDTVPFPDLTKAYVSYHKQLLEILKNE